MTTALPPQARTPLSRWHAEHAGRFTDAGAWRFPVLYSSTERELAAAREKAGLADISAFAKFSLLGRGVTAWRGALPDESTPLDVGRVARLEAGGPVMACRLTDDHVLLLADSPSSEGLRQRLAALTEAREVVAQDTTSAYAGFALIGPETEAVLRRLTALPLEQAAFPTGRCAETGLAGVQALLVRPPGSALPSVRVYVAWDVGEYIWGRLLDAGAPLGLTAMGMEAFNHLTPAA